MSKSKNGKHKQTAEPYLVSKKSSSFKEKDIPGSDDKKYILYCNICSRMAVTVLEMFGLVLSGLC